uniref:Uncharacterized protein n=1 Tax=Chromera velia CCMP2878 TaxID=1169474 RepID=A0A0G4F2P3_9ALVE|eukprot:Cvel_14740.t1-p1 / transcript=Cvel_14740.t1 / gene=Cvel_14740 / organism=Chromera_velia_CCMP2878 / gene_product=hypothetical protein / transcript_product=hypothetical protein / location=Cvel_scaffold1060:49515-49832(-) / protein_length=106 / sequence_SO=supercontig / SO=protein_coding / is_pseudo=false
MRLNMSDFENSVYSAFTASFFSLSFFFSRILILSHMAVQNLSQSVSGAEVFPLENSGASTFLNKEITYSPQSGCPFADQKRAVATFDSCSSLPSFLKAGSPLQMAV